MKDDFDEIIDAVWALKRAIQKTGGKNDIKEIVLFKTAYDFMCYQAFPIKYEYAMLPFSYDQTNKPSHIFGIKLTEG